jgi:hypothetical protein
MTKLSRSLALILALLPAFSGAVEFKDTPTPESIPRMVPIGPGVVGVTFLPAADAIKAVVPGAEIPVMPAAAVTPEAALTPNAQTPAQPEAKPEGVAGVVKAVAPQLEAIAKPETSADGSAKAGENLTTILQGGKGTEVSGGAVVVVTAGNAGPSTLAKNDGSKPSAPAAPAAPSTSAKAPKQIKSLWRYNATRWALAAIATHWGHVYSMPQASPELSQKILERKARYADAVFSDIDDTLTKFNTKLGPEIAEEIGLVRGAGKTFAAITDRPDYVKPGSSQMGALETMSAIREDKRQGVIVATNGGGKIYQYDAKGEPKLIYEEPPLPETERPLINEAAEAVKAQLAANGTAIFEKNPGGPGPYGHSMIFVGGTPEATVKKMAHVFEEELHKRGLDYNVEGRMAKDPSLPPYITFSKLNKSLAVERIIEVEKLQGVSALGMGDSMYAPQKPTELTGLKAKTSGAAAKLGAWLSGGEMPLTGNRTDANMEHGYRGMTMLSVGGTGDPRMSDGYVLAGKGPEVSRKILVEVSRRSVGSKAPMSALARALGVLGLIGLTALIYYVIIQGMASHAAMMEQQLQDGMRETPNIQWPF